MGKADAIQQQQHRVGDGKRDSYSAQKQSDKLHHKASSSGGKLENRSKSSIISQIPGAIRVCGDWSEQLSSNGKLYFFNIKTKSSQWERPREWSNSRAIDVRKEKSKLQHNRVTSKHSSDASSGGYHTTSKPHKTGHNLHSSDVKKLQAKHRNSHDSGKEFRDRDYRTANSNVKDRDYRDLDYRDKRTDSRHSLNHVDSSRSQQTQDKDYRSSNSSHENRHITSRQSSETGLSHHGRDHNGKVTSNTFSEKPENKEVDSVKDERPKSSSSTPMSSQDVSKAATSSVDSDGVNTEGTTLTNGNDGTSSLVQTLSSVLNQASQSATEDKADSTSIEGNLKNALQMLLTAAAQSQQIPGSSEKTEQQPKQEDIPHKKPRLADMTDLHIARSLDICRNAEEVLKNLGSFYEERYTNHVQGWPADQMERQSVRLCDENHQFVVNHTSQLSTTMKISRSQVRTAEVHSTIQEQRILYLRQQVKDLEKSAMITPFT